MSEKVEIGYDMARPFHVGDEAYTVEIDIGRGARAYHVGPGNFPYFSKEQAEKLAARICASSFITLECWTDGYLNPLRASDVAPRPKLSFA